MLRIRFVPVGMAVAALLILGVGATSAGGPVTPPAVKVGAADPGAATPDAGEVIKKRANAAADDAIVQECMRKIAPDLAAQKAAPQVQQTLTPEQEAQMRATKQAIGDCVQQARLAAMTPEERAQAQAKQQAGEALLQKCISQVAPELGKSSQAQDAKSRAPQDVGADKIKLAVCMGKLTPEQAAQALAQQTRALQCEQQVAPDLKALAQEPATPERDAKLRAAKQRINDCIGKP